jgi:hypothetical protein
VTSATRADAWAADDALAVGAIWDDGPMLEAGADAACEALDVDPPEQATTSAVDKPRIARNLTAARIICPASRATPE